MKKHAIVSLYLWLLMATTCSAVGLQTCDFTEVYEKAAPAVVFINVEINPSSQQGAPGQYYDPYGGTQDDFFDFFFRRGRPMPQQRPQQEQQRVLGQGSGFIVSADGYILTNNHVVKDAVKISIKLFDGRILTATVKGTDPSTDLAVIKVDAQNLPFLTLGDSSIMKITEPVLAIGNPFGLQASASAGILSATGRSGLGVSDYEDFLQTDAAINRGNSGGPLLNKNGEVIGINTAIAASAGGGYTGIGFAIPSSMAKVVMDQLIKTGNVTLGFIGVEMQAMSPESAKVLNLDKAQGVIVQEVLAGSPAANAGLVPGDVLLKCDGQPIENPVTFRNKVKLTPPGQKLNVELYRKGERQTIQLQVGEMPNSGAVADRQTVTLLGVEVATMTPALAKQYGYRQAGGVVITKVVPGSIAEQAGMQAGDIILHVNQQPVGTPEEFFAAVRDTRKGSRLMLTIQQGGIVRFIAMTLN